MPTSPSENFLDIEGPDSVWLMSLLAFKTNAIARVSRYIDAIQLRGITGS